MVSSKLVCAGCGAVAQPGDPYPFRCAHAGTGDVDHLMVRVLLDNAGLTFPRDGDPDPFVRYRTLLHSYHLATSGGLSDDDYVALVDRLEQRIAEVDGRAFAVTPFERQPSLGAALEMSPRGAVWVKDETGNVSGSHKGRHLMGVQLHLEVVSALGLEPDDAPDLAIASCGNAALAAAVVAAAARRRLHVFVPVDADPRVVSRLRSLGADVVVCERKPDVPGDPCYLRLRAALEAGMLPYTCQGNENGLAIEGGETLPYEMVSSLGRHGERLDHVVVQVGGGALASAVVAGLREAVVLGELDRMPAVHTVQTQGAHPLERAYHLVRQLLPTRPSPTDVAQALGFAARHRSQFMWPWEDEPKSIAHGILDDETYDWRAVVAGMLETGGRPVVVDEDVLAAANGLAVASTAIPVDATGSAGLAGLMALRRDGTIGADERVAVLFTGARR